MVVAVFGQLDHLLRERDMTVADLRRQIADQYGLDVDAASLDHLAGSETLHHTDLKVADAVASIPEVSFDDLLLVIAAYSVPWPVPAADVVLSHAAGWHRRVAAGTRSYDVCDEQIARAIRESGARLALSGHHHRWLTGRTNGGRTRCFGLGNRSADWAVLDTRTRRGDRPMSPS